MRKSKLNDNNDLVCWRNDYNDGLCEIEAVKMRDNIRSKRNCINKTGSEQTTQYNVKSEMVAGETHEITLNKIDRQQRKGEC